MTRSVQGHGMTFIDNAARQLRMTDDVRRQHEKSSLRLGVAQRIQEQRGGFRIWAIVKCQRDRPAQRPGLAATESASEDSQFSVGR